MRAATLALMSLVLASHSATGAIKLKKDGERKRAPDFELKNGDGKTVRLTDYPGKVILLDFWATWCGPCKASIPWMNELAETYRGDGLVVLGISMDEEGWSVVKPFAEQMKIKYPIVVGNPRVAYLYGDVASLPVAFFIDRDQRVAAVHLGAANRKDVEKAIQTLLERTTSGPSAPATDSQSASPSGR